MRVSSTFVRNNTFAALLIPGILSTPSGDIGHGFGIAAWTAWTSVAGAISTTGVSECQCEDKEDKNDDFHLLIKRYLQGMNQVQILTSAHNVHYQTKQLPTQYNFNLNAQILLLNLLFVLKVLFQLRCSQSLICQLTKYDSLQFYNLHSAMDLKQREHNKIDSQSHQHEPSITLQEKQVQFSCQEINCEDKIREEEKHRESHESNNHEQTVYEEIIQEEVKKELLDIFSKDKIKHHTVCKKFMYVLNIAEHCQNIYSLLRYMFQQEQMIYNPGSSKQISERKPIVSHLCHFSSQKDPSLMFQTLPLASSFLSREQLEVSLELYQCCKSVNSYLEKLHINLESFHRINQQKWLLQIDNISRKIQGYAQNVDSILKEETSEDNQLMKVKEKGNLISSDKCNAKSQEMQAKEESFINAQNNKQAEAPNRKQRALASYKAQIKQIKTLITFLLMSLHHSIKHLMMNSLLQFNLLLQKLLQLLSKIAEWLSKGENITQNRKSKDMHQFLNFFRQRGVQSLLFMEQIYKRILSKLQDDRRHLNLFAQLNRRRRKHFYSKNFGDIVGVLVKENRLNSYIQSLFLSLEAKLHLKVERMKFEKAIEIIVIDDDEQDGVKMEEEVPTEKDKKITIQHQLEKAGKGSSEIQSEKDDDQKDKFEQLCEKIIGQCHKIEKKNKRQQKKRSKPGLRKGFTRNLNSNISEKQHRLQQDAKKECSNAQISNSNFIPADGSRDIQKANQVRKEGPDGQNVNAQEKGVDFQKTSATQKRSGFIQSEQLQDPNKHFQINTGQFIYKINLNEHYNQIPAQLQRNIVLRYPQHDFESPKKNKKHKHKHKHIKKESKRKEKDPNRRRKNGKNHSQLDQESSSSLQFLMNALGQQGYEKIVMQAKNQNQQMEKNKSCQKERKQAECKEQFNRKPYVIDYQTLEMKSPKSVERIDEIIEIKASSAKKSHISLKYWDQIQELSPWPDQCFMQQLKKK